jgi:ATP-binding cassette subfamily B (MDR/TAP) protein 1
MDADCIHVMGDGVVVESGKHDELLTNEDGPYARLVAAQRLREVREGIDVDIIGQSSGKAVEGHMDIEKAALEEIPLGQSITHQSLASEVLEQRKTQSPAKREEHSMFCLFTRMGRINKGEWKSYLFGCLFAMGQYSL